MNDIVSTPPAPASPADSKVTTGDWWPDVDINPLRDRVNLGSVIPHDRLVEAVEMAVIDITGELTSWATAKLTAGAANLAAVDPDDQVNGKTRLEKLFISAVSAATAARLADRNPDLTATREGSERGDQRRDMADDFRRDATHAIRQMRGETRTASELI